MKHKFAVFVTIITLPLAFLPSASASSVPSVRPLDNHCLQQIRIWFAGPAEHRFEDIAWRESGWQENPKPFRASLGCLQINTSNKAHGPELRRLGITRAMLGQATWNVAYARLLFARSGTQPWVLTR